MKVGDLVRNSLACDGELGLVVDMVQKKCWRSIGDGTPVNWDVVDPEPHAVVLYPGRATITVPVTDLEVRSEGR